MEAVELCADCVHADANGEAGEGLELWAGFHDRWQGWRFGPAILDYACDAVCGGCDVCRESYENHSEGHFVRPGSACDGCGSGLGGQRWDYVAVEIG